MPADSTAADLDIDGDDNSAESVQATNNSPPMTVGVPTRDVVEGRRYRNGHGLRSAAARLSLSVYRFNVG